MDKEKFRSFLKARESSEEKLNALVAIAERYEAFLGGTAGGTAAEVIGKTPAAGGKEPSARSVLEFARLLTKEGADVYENFRGLALYGRYTRNNDVYVAAIQFLDGAEALESLYEKVGQAVGPARRDEIFRGLRLPRLGTPSTERPRFTQAFIERLVKHVDAETVRKLLSGGLRRIPDEEYHDTRLKYLECKSVDEYLDRKSAAFVEELERIKNEGGLYFNQEITDEVLEFVKSTPEICRGVVRDGVFYETKIPYMAKEYLAESDPRMKRYYYCHCPWVRESLRTGDADVPRVFCHCSLGFTKQPWQVIFGQQLEGEVLETVLSGGMVCRFAIKLPADVR